MDTKTITEGIPRICGNVAGIISEYTRPNMQDIVVLFTKDIVSDLLAVDNRFTATISSTYTNISICIYEEWSFRDRIDDSIETEIMDIASIFITKRNVCFELIWSKEDRLIDIDDTLFEEKIRDVLSHNGFDDVREVIVKYTMLCRSKLI